jgi:hypothetical protein
MASRLFNEHLAVFERDLLEAQQNKKNGAHERSIASRNALRDLFFAELLKAGR